MLYDTFSVGENWQQSDVTEGNTARMYWATWDTWSNGYSKTPARLYAVQPDWLRATGLSELINWDAWVWLPRYLLSNGGERYRPPIRDLKSNIPVSVNEIKERPYYSRRAFRKAFPAPAKRRKAVVS